MSVILVHCVYPGDPPLAHSLAGSFPGLAGTCRDFPGRPGVRVKNPEYVLNMDVFALAARPRRDARQRRELHAVVAIRGDEAPLEQRI